MVGSFDCSLDRILDLLMSSYPGLAITVIPYMRWKQPNLYRPVSVPLPLAILFILLCGFLIVVPLIDGKQMTILLPLCFPLKR